MKPIWGLDEEVELKSIFRDCGSPNTFFMVGALNIARFNSRMIALQSLPSVKVSSVKDIQSKNKNPFLSQTAMVIKYTHVKSFNELLTYAHPIIPPPVSYVPDKKTKRNV
ncbi:hypothetical protein TRICI_000088 [Trichomonascus ciferrii]|uniref:Uncharacterized protein n=1 Tax=Trichomonascus ciferrii TaxID=44093 RepID=A0A642VEH1_9ASCO|nr:hypothetical protein TRICI_000088 [Trichomonascus ciferrii]